MKYVSQILESKGYDIWSISKDSTVYKALQLMAEKDVGALLVLEKGELVGIFSERDYARKALNSSKSPRKIRVDEVMVPKVIYVQPDQTLEECMALMTHKHFRHLPIMENEKLIGLITIGDVVKALISEKDFMIQQLDPKQAYSGRLWVDISASPVWAERRCRDLLGYGRGVGGGGKGSF